MEESEGGLEKMVRGDKVKEECKGMERVSIDLCVLFLLME